MDYFTVAFLLNLKVVLCDQHKLIKETAKRGINSDRPDDIDPIILHHR